MNHFQIRRHLVRVFIAIAMASAGIAFADNYPSRPIRLVAPFAAGGASDALARTLADALREQLKQTVIVDNRAGAGGTLGVGAVAIAPPDGYTLVLGGTGSVIFTEGVYKLSYSVQKNLRPIALVGSAQSAIVVRSSLPVNSLADLVKRSRESPQLSYGSPGMGSALHLAGVQFEQLGGGKLLHVPYKGQTPAFNDLLAGNIDLVFANISSLASYIQSGKVKALAVIDTRESPLLPGVPTSAAAGMPKLVMNTWYGLLAPAGTPDAVSQKLEAAVAAALKSPGFVDALKAQGFDPEPEPSEAKFASVIKRDYQQWVPMIRKLNLQTQ